MKNKNKKKELKSRNKKEGEGKKKEDKRETIRESKEKQKEAKITENKDTPNKGGYLSKIQSLSERKRKMIFWLVLSVVATLLFVAFMSMVIYRIKNFKAEDFENQINFPSFNFDFNEK